MTAKTSAHPLMPKQLIEWLLAVLLIVSPFYIASSLGGTGLDLPFNITVWLVASWVIAYMLWHVAIQAKIILPKIYLALLALPAGILISAAVSGVQVPTDWFFRIVFVFAGVLFLFGLFQFRIRNTDRLLLLIAISTLLHGLYGLAQLFRPDFVMGWLPQTATPMAIGVFYQVNAMASFLVTGIVVSVYLLFRPITDQRRILQVFLIITLTLATYVMVATGSRIGLISALLALILLLIGFFPQVKKRPVRALVILSTIMCASWLAQEGLHKTLDKSYRLVEANYSDQRMVIYKVSVDVIAQSPLLGHGIGSFMEKWGRASADFHAQNPDIAMPGYLAHPHNELLQWAIEGGIVAVLGILIAASAILWLAVYSKKRRNLVYLALLLPITFHSMVEHPFYISSLHWFVWLALVFILLNHQTTARNNQMSMMARSTLKIASLIIFVTGSMFVLHSLFAQKQLYAYTKQLQTTPMMREALNNPYFKHQAEQVVMRVRLHNAIEQNNQLKIQEIANWLESEISVKPELHLFGDLLNAYIALDDKRFECQTAASGLEIYPINNALRQIMKTCDVTM